MSKKITAPVAEVSSNQNEVIVPVVKNTPVADRKYALAVERPQLKSKQASIVLDTLAASEGPMTINEIAPLAEAKGLKAVGGVAASVRYHLHHMTKDGVTMVTNPTFLLQ